MENAELQMIPASFDRQPREVLMLPAEKMELVIYHYICSVGVNRSVMIPDLAGIVGANTPHVMIVERLIDLKNQNRIGLFKYSGGTRVSYDQFVGFEGDESAFYGGGFVIEIAPHGRKYFEELELRDQQERESGSVLEKSNAMPRRVSHKESVPPTLQPHQAIELLRRQLGQLEEVITLHHRDPKIDAWESTTTSILDGAFGKPNGDQDGRTRQLARACDHASYPGMPDSEYQKYHLEGHKNRRALLQAYIDQLQILAPPAAATAIDQYIFHSEIERVSGHLYRDGHYKQAALEAYIRVIDEVKAKSHLPVEGDSLMNRAFGCENQTPVIQFNNLKTDAEKDEQKGFMFLYKGIVSLRNSKAHSNRLFNDPNRAHEYLALASLLMRVLELATINGTLS